MEPSPFLPQTTIAIEKVKIAAKEAQPIWKIIKLNIFNIILTEIQFIFIKSKLKLISQKLNLVNRINKNFKLGQTSIKS